MYSHAVATSLATGTVVLRSPRAAGGMSRIYRSAMYRQYRVPVAWFGLVYSFLTRRM